MTQATNNMTSKASIKASRKAPHRTEPLRSSIRLYLNRKVEKRHAIKYNEPLENKDLHLVAETVEQFTKSMGRRMPTSLRFKVKGKHLTFSSGTHHCVLTSGKVGEDVMLTQGSLYCKRRSDWLYGIVYGITQHLFKSFTYETNARGYLLHDCYDVDASVYFSFISYNLEAFFERMVM